VKIDRMVGYAREAFLDGYYVPWGSESNGGWIQQESTFWTRDLWQAAGGRAGDELGLAGDFELWSRFYDHETLYATPALLGGFRLHGSGHRSDDRETYVREASAALEAMRRRGGWHRSRSRALAGRLRLMELPGARSVVGRRIGYTAHWVVRVGGRWRVDRPRFLHRTAVTTYD
jgi:hypothetical protein